MRVCKKEKHQLKHFTTATRPTSNFCNIYFTAFYYKSRYIKIHFSLTPSPPAPHLIYPSITVSIIIYKEHPPQTFPGWAQCVCSWAQRSGQPACQSSHSTTGLKHHLLDPDSRPLGVVRTTQLASAPVPQPGSGPLPACGLIPLHSLRFCWKGGGKDI